MWAVSLPFSFLISLPHRLDIGYLSSAALLAARQTLRLPLALRMLNPSSIRILHHVKCLFDIVVLVRWLFLFSCSFLQTHPFASITSLLHRVLRAPPCALKSPPIRMCVCLCVFVFLHLSVCFWSSEYTFCTCSSPYPVRGKYTGETCSLNFFFTMETLVNLGQECCTSLMCLVHLLWMSIAVAWHALLFLVAAKVRRCFVVHNSSFCFLYVSLTVTVFQCPFSPSPCSWMSSGISSHVTQGVFVWTTVIVIVCEFLLLRLCRGSLLVAVVW